MLPVAYSEMPPEFLPEHTSSSDAVGTGPLNRKSHSMEKLFRTFGVLVESQASGIG